MSGVKEIQVPWQPSCWVGGKSIWITRACGCQDFYWIDSALVPLLQFSDESRTKYAAVKATSAIMRAMRK